MRNSQVPVRNPDFRADVERVTSVLACPVCQSEIVWNPERGICSECSASFGISDEFIDLRPRDSASKPESHDWSEHWSDQKQKWLVQRFFSFYRKAVFSRAVRYYVDTFLAPSGLLLEAGCGTSETSMRIDKGDGERTLVAVDIVPIALTQCHPVMDVKMCADIFQLPFRGCSVDGIWNVGVMEHFLHAQVDSILAEFHRILRPGARLVLLWPATDSIPQKMLRAIEAVVNIRRRGAKFRFHPDEISKLRSNSEARDVLSRNGFRVVQVDRGIRSLMAFKILVGEKVQPSE